MHQKILVSRLISYVFYHRRTGPFPFGGAQQFLPEFLIFARKVKYVSGYVLGNAFLPQIVGGGEGEQLFWSD